jgi:hypothetical protein
MTTGVNRLVSQQHSQSRCSLIHSPFPYRLSYLLIYYSYLPFIVQTSFSHPPSPQPFSGLGIEEIRLGVSPFGRPFSSSP